MPPFEEEMAYCFANVGLSVTFLFLINNSKLPWPSFLKCGPHINPG